jgi:hypothetical protein
MHPSQENRQIQIICWTHTNYAGTTYSIDEKYWNTVETICLKLKQFLHQINLKQSKITGRVHLKRKRQKINVFRLSEKV